MTHIMIKTKGHRLTDVSQLHPSRNHHVRHLLRSTLLVALLLTSVGLRAQTNYGERLFAFELMGIDKNITLNQL